MKPEANLGCEEEVARKPPALASATPSPDRPSARLHLHIGTGSSLPAHREWPCAASSTVCLACPATRALCSTLDKVTPGPSTRSASSDQVDPDDEWLALVDTNNRRRSLTDRSHQERLRSVQMSLRSTMPAINGTPRGTDCPVRSDPCVSCARRENSF